MTRLMVRYSIAAALLFAWAVTAAAQKPAPEPVNSAPFAGAIVSEWTGKISLQLPGRLHSAPARGQKLPVGTLLDTQDGMLVLTLEDESQILVRPHTRLVLKQPGLGDWNYFELLFGRVRAYIRKRTGGAPPFQLGTPSAVVAVRGTRFDVLVNRRDVTEVDVYQGLVEVAGAGIRGKSVLVKPGYSTRVGMGMPPEQPVPTYDIRPDTSPPDPTIGAEFLRQVRDESLHASESEMSERRDSEMNELEEESQEAIEGPNDPDHD